MRRLWSVERLLLRGWRRKVSGGSWLIGLRSREGIVAFLRGRGVCEMGMRFVRLCSDSRLLNKDGILPLVGDL